MSPSDAVSKSYMSTGAAAKLASCHRTTILRAILSGELPAVRLGPTGDFRIPQEAFDEWLTPVPAPDSK